MADANIRFTIDTSGVEKTLEIIARHLTALGAELKQAREYPHGITDDHGRPTRPDGSVITIGGTRCSACGRIAGAPSAPCSRCPG